MGVIRLSLVRIVLPIASLCVLATGPGFTLHASSSRLMDLSGNPATSIPHASPAAPVPSYVVTTASDDTNGLPANCAGAGTSNCSLRDALAAAATGGGTITFDAIVFGSPTTIILGSGGSLTLPSNTSVNGLTSGSGYNLTNLVTISGGSLHNDFVVNKGTTAAELANLTLSNDPLPGSISQNFGALMNNGGSVSLRNSSVVDTYTFNGAGAIFNGVGGSLTADGCTFTANDGAIVNEGTATITNSTFADNEPLALNSPSGVANSGALTVVSSTFTGNYLPDVETTGTISATNSILDCSGTGCPVDHESGNVVNGEAQLSELGSFGGPTLTSPLIPGFAGICEGVPTPLETDQRGLPRSTTYGSNTCYDSGAVQGRYAYVFNTEPPVNVTAGSSFALGLQLEESGLPFEDRFLNAVPLALGAGDNGALNFNSLPFEGSAASTSGLSVSLPGSGDTLVSSLSLTEANPPSGVPNLSLAAVSSLFNVTSANVTVTVSSEAESPMNATPAFSVDGISYSKPITFTWAVGSTHTLSTTSPQNANGCDTEVFSYWSDRGAISHTVTALSSTTLYEVSFAPVPSTPSTCVLTTGANPAAGGTVTPSTASYSYGTYVALTAIPKSGYTFANWTGPVISPASASTAVYVLGGQTVTANFNALTTQTIYVVNSVADDAVGNPASCATAAGTCTLRDALVGAAEAGKGDITFSPAVFAASQPMSARTINLNAPLIITSNTTITGPTIGSGPTLTQLVIIVPSSPGFQVNNGTTGAVISGLMIAGGNFSGAAPGTAVSTDGTLTISNSAITGVNSGDFDGGGAAVFNDVDGTLTLTSCNISDNTDNYGSSGGAGILNHGTLVITGSSISGNSTEDVSGAGLANEGTATLTNTTVSGNQIRFYNNGGVGGGIFNSGILNLVDSSITGNSATNPGDGSGIYNRGTLHINGSSIVSNLTDYNESYDGEPFPAVEDDCDGPGCPAETTPAPPTFTPPSGTYSSLGTVIPSDTSPHTVFFYTLDGSTPTTSSNLIAGEPISLGGNSVQTVKAIAFANGEASAVAKATYTIPTGSACTLIDYSAGFMPAGLSLNGGAVVKGNLLQLTDGGSNEARSAFYSTAVPVNEFTTDFQFQLLYALADGITFTIQSASPQALGQPGGGLGYAGIPKSVALKFDLFNNDGEGFDSTGYYLNGAYPSTPALSLLPYGIYLHSGHIFAVHITYIGGITTGTITDLTTYQSYTASVPGDLTKLVGNTAYVGFTGGTGGLTATQNILTWTYGGGSGCGTMPAP